MIDPLTRAQKYLDDQHYPSDWRYALFGLLLDHDRYYRMKWNKWFLLRCRSENKIPKFIQNETPTTDINGTEAGNTTFQKRSLVYSQKRLSDKVKDAHRIIDKCESNMIERERRARDKYDIPQDIINDFLELFTEQVQCFYLKNKKAKLKEKLAALSPVTNKPQHRPPEDYVKTPAASRVSYINTAISDIQTNLLALGPNYAVKDFTKENKEETMTKVDQGVERFNYGFRWSSRIQATTPADKPKKTKPIPDNQNTKKSPPPLLNAKTETMLKNLKTEIVSISNQCYDKEVTSNASNICKDQKQALKALQKDKSIVVKQSDKDKQLVVANRDTYIDKCLDHLKDTTTYEQITRNPLTKAEAAVQEVAAAWTLKDPDLEEKIKPYEPRIPEFYGTWKTHKKEKPPPIRPVVSNIDSPTENLAHLANSILTQAVGLIPVNITSTEKFMERMQKTFNNKLTERHILFTADVKSLYTSIPLKHCLEVTVKYIKDQQENIDMHNLTIKEFELILAALLQIGYFRFNDMFFKQIKGLAMGSRPAPPLAILYVYLTVEKPLLENDFTYALNHIPKPPDIKIEYWDRYVDDVFSAIQGDEQTVDRLFAYVNQLNPDIQFTHECESEVPYLDLLVSRDPTTNSPLFNIYFKPTNLGIFLNYNSHHPRNIIINTAKNEYKRALKNCSNDDLKSKAFKRISYTLLDNDYPSYVIDEILKDVISNEFKKRDESTAPRPTSVICLPFISEQCSRKVKQAIRNQDLQDKVRIVFKPGTTLKQSLVRTKFTPTKCTSQSVDTCTLCQQYGRYQYKHCQTKSVVYKIKCNFCDDVYIGETGKPFRCRIRTHFLSVKNKNRSTALGVHFLESHADIVSIPDQPFTASLLQTCTDWPNRKIAEATHIKNLLPAINTQLVKTNTKKKQFSVDSWAVF